MANVPAVRRLFAGLNLRDEGAYDFAHTAFVNLITDDRVDHIPCRMAPDMWWSHDRNEQAEAKRACNELCPLRQQCLTYAMAAKESEGIWGGLDYEERKARNRSIQAAARRSRQSAAAKAGLPVGV